MIKDFTDLDAWQKGHQLVLEIYRLAKSFPKDELFALTIQIRRAAISVTSNIAEGFGRISIKEKIHFYFIAQGSITELQNQLIIARDLDYLSGDNFENCLRLSRNTAQIISGLIRSCKARLSRTPGY